jgi:hypothetical protein
MMIPEADCSKSPSQGHSDETLTACGEGRTD